MKLGTLLFIKLLMIMLVMKIDAIEFKSESSIVITSETSEYCPKKNCMTFTDEVRADDGQVKLTCEYMQVFLDENQQPERVLCNGEVIIRRDQSVAYSDQANYSLKKETITLSGKAKVVSVNKKGKKNTTRGRLIIYDLIKNTVVVKNSKIEIESSKSNESSTGRR